MSRPEKYPRITDKKVYDANFDAIFRKPKPGAPVNELRRLARSRLSKKDRESILVNGLNPCP